MTLARCCFRPFLTANRAAPVFFFGMLLTVQTTPCAKGCGLLVGITPKHSPVPTYWFWRNRAAHHDSSATVTLPKMLQSAHMLFLANFVADSRTTGHYHCPTMYKT
jgi:hypothetical protein